MICIFSTANDYSTTEVMKWLRHLGQDDVIRVNHRDAASNDTVRIDLASGEFQCEIGDHHFLLRDIEAVWYRKGANWLCDQFTEVTIAGHPKLAEYLNKKIRAEEFKLAEYLHFLIESSSSVLGAFNRCDLNKLVVLHTAKQIGLLVPTFYVTNHRDGVENFVNCKQGLITKALSDGLYLFEKTQTGRGYFSYTEKLDTGLLDDLPDEIPPSFLQHQIEKSFDVRVFFLRDTCYSMAIFSQADEQTRIDYRRYNEETPNRNVPFRLPNDVDHKLKLLFKKLNLNTGSADLIVDLRGDFYFLEINPVGQFGMLSAACNYFLEKEVALTLIEYARRSREHRVVRV